MTHDFCVQATDYRYESRTGLLCKLKLLICDYKMAQQGKQMRVGAREGFAYHSVKLVLLANGNRYEVDSNTCFLYGKALYPKEIVLSQL